MPPGTPVEISFLASAWALVQQGWAAGGLAFVLFAIVVGLLTDQVVPGRRHRSVVSEWQKRYDDDQGKLQKRLDDTERERDMLLNMFLAQQGTFKRGMDAATVVATAAHEVVATAAAVIPAPPPERRRWWQL
jgi:hypothetical protein